MQMEPNYTLNLPERIQRLEELAKNLYWTWEPEARALFRNLDRPLWESSGHNPVKILKYSTRLKALSKEPGFLRNYEHVLHKYDTYMRSKGWFDDAFQAHNMRPIAYISAEFGLHQSLPIYSGGLGILAGDHVKEASDLGIPFIGLGYMYPQGYFKQMIGPSGWQQAYKEDFKFDETALQPIADQLLVETPNQDIYVRVWKVNVGRTQLFLFDTNVEKNAPWDRELSARLYGGDREIRLRQEIVLGFAAVRILESLDIDPLVWHLNEGHTAFATLDRIETLVKDGYSFNEAMNLVRNSTVFTSHTPVPAGHDTFSFDLMERYFCEYWEGLGINKETFMSLGTHDAGWGPLFNMTALGIRLSKIRNGVSQLNAKICKEMWKDFKKFPGNPSPEVNFIGITNGVHVPTWIAGPVQALFDRYLGDDWLNKQDDRLLWQKLDDIPDKELWDTRLRVKDRLFYHLREWARTALRSGKDPRQIYAGGSLFGSRTLTFGFARRFATYKRAGLIFSDMDRLKKLLLDPYQPIQIIFAGKAHPADEPGKAMLQKIYKMALDPTLGGRIAFLENYDMQISRYLVQGTDVWLNTPRRPLEASGTSGQKAAMNGVINFSILDGWWPEAYNGGNGWAIGKENEYKDQNKQDQEDAESVYDTLENELIPLFYQRDRDKIPRGWLEMVRESIKTVVPNFATRAMVKKYTQDTYLPLVSKKTDDGNWLPN